MKSIRNLLLLSLSVAIIMSCNKNTFEDVNLEDTAAYTNITPGKWREYTYDTINYRGASRDTFSGKLRIETGELFLNQGGDSLYKQFVYWKNDTMPDYILHRVETIRFKSNELIETQDGLQFIKLKQPLLQNSSWNAHSYFNNSEAIIEIVKGEPIKVYEKQDFWVTQVTSINQPVTINNKVFPMAATLSLIDSPSGISYKFAQEVYVKDIGLAERKITILFRDSTTGKPLIEDASRGFITTINLTDHN